MPARRAPAAPSAAPFATAPDLKEACVRAAREVIAEQGVEQLSLRDVARRLGVSHQAPYKHYASRDHLLAEVMQRCFQSFAAHLDARPRHADPATELGALGRQYLGYAASHPLEYRLMFGTPWPDPAAHAGLVQDAAHAFDVLRSVLRRLHGEGASQRARVDLDALFIWSSMHGLASIGNAQVMDLLALAPGVGERAVPHVMAMLSAALQSAAPASAKAAGHGTRKR
jgi:AcrR family transcriptional regulator